MIWWPFEKSSAERFSNRSGTQYADFHEFRDAEARGRDAENCRSDSDILTSPGISG